MRYWFAQKRFFAILPNFTSHIVLRIKDIPEKNNMDGKWICRTLFMNTVPGHE